MTLWRSRDYRWWFAGDTGATAAIFLRQFTVPLLAYALSGSTALAGLLATATGIVGTVAILPGGVLVDRHDRRLLMRLYALGGFAVWGVVAALAASGWLSFWVFLAFALLGALNGGLFGHATDAALRSLVPVPDYPRAMAANQGRDATVQLATGPVGGLLYALAPAVPFAGAAVGHALAALATWGIRADLRPPHTERRGALVEASDALRWLWSKRRVRSLMPVLACANLGLAGAIMGVQLSLLARGHDAVQLGWLFAALAGATLVGAVASAWLVPRVATGRLASATLWWMGACLAPVAVWDAYPVQVAGLAALALAAPAVNASLLGYLFGLTPQELQGRVHATLGLVTGGLAALGPALAGGLLPAVGHTATLAAFAAIVVACAAALTTSTPIRQIPRPAHWQEAPL